MSNNLSRLYSLRSFLLMLFLVSFPAFSKSFYLTVRRDFSPSEAPNIELIYNNNIPITLRVLKPKDMKSFISEQIDLRRSWKEPVSEYNSARYLLRGLNLTQVNPDWIRYSVRSSVRDPFKEKLGGADFFEAGTSLSTGPKKIIRTPKDFELITEFTINPNKDDNNEAFDVPGFEWYFGSESHFRSRLVALPPQNAGFYVLQAIQGSNEGQVLLVVNNLRALLEQTDGKALIRVTDREGKAEQGVSALLRGIDGKWIGSGDTDKNGFVELSTGKANEVIAVLQKGESTAVIDTEFLSANAEFPDVFIYSDRPMYKPGHTAKFKGILRKKESGLSAIFKSKGEVSTKVFTSDGSLVADAVSSKVTEFASYSGEAVLKTEASGVYRIESQVNGQDHGGEIRVKDYVKPLFFVTLSSPVDSLKPGQQFPLTIKSERYAGGVPMGLTARIEVFRSRFDGPEWIDDAGLGEAGNPVTYGFSGDAKSPIIPISVHVMENVSLGNSGSSTVTVNLPTDFPGDPGYDYKLQVRVRVVDSDGNDASGSKSFFEATKNILLQLRASGVYVESGQSAYADLRALTPAGNPFGKTSGSAEYYHLPYGGSRELLKKENISTDDKGKLRLNFPTEKSGLVIVKVNLNDQKGGQEVSETEILVADPKSTAPIKKVLDPVLLTRRDTYLVDETAKILLLLPEEWGIKGSDRGTIYTTVAGRKVYSTHAEIVKGQSYWINLKLREDLGSAAYVIVSYSDPVVGFKQKSIRLRILPADKNLKVTVTPVHDVLEPGKEQSIEIRVLDYKNSPVKSELSLSVVDRAVLDLQPEFRPQLMDFFYPTDRLNLMSFFSGDFQSYGYAETIARLFKPNHSYSALKPEEEPKKEEDTAYWNPTVLTDADGKARVSFRLPINQTIWKATAVAIDKKGRFGESTAEFKANSSLPITVAMPANIRQGENFHLRLQAENLSKSSTRKIDLKIEIPTGFTSEGELEQKEIAIKGGEKFGYRIPINVLSDSQIGPQSIVARVMVDGEELSFAQEISVIDGSARVPVREDIENGKPLNLELAKGESFSTLKVRTFEGLSGTVIPALKWMTAYPFGCAEQLVNTTLPNLAIASVLGLVEATALDSTESGVWVAIKSFFRKIYHWFLGIFSGPRLRLNAEQEKTLQTAIENARSGILKIQALQAKEGDRSGLFSWFSGAEADLRLQYYILMSFASVNDPKLLEGIDVAAAFRALSMHRYTFQTTQTPILDVYLKSQFIRMNLIEDSLGPADLRFAIEGAMNQSNPLLAAYALRALAAANEEAAVSVKDLRQKLVDYVKKSLEEALDRPTETDFIQRTVMPQWNGYIGRSGSFIAILARSLHESKSIPSVLRNRVRKKLATLFNGESFGSTFETGQILLNSVWLLKEEIKKRDLGSLPKLVVNGKAVKEGAVASLAGWELPIDRTFLSETKNEVQLDGSEEMIRAKVIGDRRSPMESARAVSGRHRLERSIYKLNETTQELSPLGPSTALQIGDLLYVEHDLSAGRGGNYFASSYYVLQSDLPGGTSFVEDDNRFSQLNVFRERSGWKKREEVKGRINYYFDFERGWMDALRQGRKVGYVVRLNYAGKFSAGLSRFEDFYDEDGFSQTASQSFTVRPPLAR